MPSLLDTDAIREHVETDLSDTALQQLIDDAEAEIVTKFGAHSETGEIVEEHVVMDGERWIYPRRVLDPALPVTITRQEFGSSDVTIADEAEYALSATTGGIRLLATGPWAGQLVTIEYTARTDAPRRKRVLIDLVRLALRYDAARNTSMGDMSVSHVAYQQERNQILASLSTLVGGMA